MGCRESQNSNVFWVSFVWRLVSICSDLVNVSLNLCSGDIVSDLKIWENYLYNYEKDTGEFSVSLVLWKQFVVEESLVRYLVLHYYYYSNLTIFVSFDF